MILTQNTKPVNEKAAVKTAAGIELFEEKKTATQSRLCLCHLSMTMQ